MHSDIQTFQQHTEHMHSFHKQFSDKTFSAYMTH